MFGRIVFKSPLVLGLVALALTSAAVVVCPASAGTGPGTSTPDSACLLPAPGTKPGTEPPCGKQWKSGDLKHQKDGILANEKLGKWRAITWETSAASAITRAQRENKPILVVLEVSELGRKKSADT